MRRAGKTFEGIWCGFFCSIELSVFMLACLAVFTAPVSANPAHASSSVLPGWH